MTINIDFSKILHEIKFLNDDDAIETLKWVYKVGFEHGDRDMWWLQQEKEYKS